MKFNGYSIMCYLNILTVATILMLSGSCSNIRLAQIDNITVISNDATIYDSYLYGMLTKHMKPILQNYELHYKVDWTQEDFLVSKFSETVYGSISIVVNYRLADKSGIDVLKHKVLLSDVYDNTAEPYHTYLCIEQVKHNLLHEASIAIYQNIYKYINTRGVL